MCVQRVFYEVWQIAIHVSTGDMHSMKVGEFALLEEAERTVDELFAMANITNFMSDVVINYAIDEVDPPQIYYEMRGFASLAHLFSIPDVH